MFRVPRRLLGVKKIGNGTKEDYKLFLKADSQFFRVVKYTNCLFIPAADCNPEPPKVYRGFNRNQNKEFNKNVETRSPKSESSFWPLLSFGLLFLMFSFLTVLLLVKSSSRFVGRFDRKSSEAQVVSNLVDKPVDLKLDELKKERGNESTRSISSLDRTQNDSQLNLSDMPSLSKSTIESNQLNDQCTTGLTNRTEQTSGNQTKPDGEPIKKKVKYDDDL